MVELMQPHKPEVRQGAWLSAVARRRAGSSHAGSCSCRRLSAFFLQREDEKQRINDADGVVVWYGPVRPLVAHTPSLVPRSAAALICVMFLSVGTEPGASTASSLSHGKQAEVAGGKAGRADGLNTSAALAFVFLGSALVPPPPIYFSSSSTPPLLSRTALSRPFWPRLTFSIRRRQRHWRQKAKAVGHWPARHGRV